MNLLRARYSRNRCHLHRCRHPKRRFFHSIVRTFGVRKMECDPTHTPGHASARWEREVVRVEVWPTTANGERYGASLPSSSTSLFRRMAREIPQAPSKRLGCPTSIVAGQVGWAKFCGPTVALNVGAIALAGRTVAARTGGLDDHNLVGPELHAAGLWGQLGHGAIAMLQREPPAQPGLGAKDTPGRLAEALTHAIELAGVSNRPDASPKPQAATKPARAPRVGDQRVLLDAERIFHFDRLNR